MGDQETNKVAETPVKKKAKMSTVKLQENTESINILNDDCLIHIFEFLSITEKFRMESVSKRFNELSKLSWSPIKTCSIREYESFFENYLVPPTAVNQILDRCSLYLKEIKISCQCSSYEKKLSECELCFNTIKKLTSSSVINLERFRFYQSSATSHNVIDDDLELLFKRNKFLKFLNLQISMTGKCFSALPLHQIEGLKLVPCKLEARYVKEYFPLLKNLKKVEISLSWMNNILENIILAMSENCFLIQDLSIILNRGHIDMTKQMENLISRNKNLSSLKLSYININSSCLAILEDSAVESMNLYACNVNSDNLINYFPKLKKLKKLELLKNEIIVEKHVKALSLCKNLKILSLQNNYETIRNFKKFVNLIYLRLDCSDITDSCLIDITKCEQLVSLTLIDNSDTDGFTDTGLTEIRKKLLKLKDLHISGSSATDKSLSEFTNLETLAIVGCEKVENKGLQTLIKNSSELELLDLYCHRQITYEFIDFALDKKNINKNRKKVLFITVGEEIDLDEVQNNSSPIVKIVDEIQCYYDYYCVPDDSFFKY